MGVHPIADVIEQPPSDIDWYCRRCGVDLGDDATVASGDCADCGLIMCEGCFDYDEDTAAVTCPPEYSAYCKAATDG